MRRIAWWMVLAVSVGCSGDEAGPNEKDSNNPTVIITDALCGDGRISGEEVCDGEALGGESCEARGFGGGVLGEGEILGVASWDRGSAAGEERRRQHSDSNSDTSSDSDSDRRRTGHPTALLRRLRASTLERYPAARGAFGR